MTDTSIADKIYMEPLTLEYVAKILRYERPDAIIPGIGGQTGLNLAMQLSRKGILKECGTELLGTPADSIERAEDRELFKEMCQSIGEPVIPSEITYGVDEAKAAAERIGYPVVLRPAPAAALQTMKKSLWIWLPTRSRSLRSIRCSSKRASKDIKK